MRLVRPSAGLAAAARPAWVGARRRERVDVQSLLETCAEPGPGGRSASGPPAPPPLPAGQSLVEARGPGRFVVETAEGRALLERRPPTGARFGPSAAARAHRMAHALRAAGIETPRVLAYLERPRQPARGDSWLVTEWLRAPSLAELEAAGVLGDPAEQARVGHAVARSLAALHAAGFVHPGLHPGRVLVTEAGIALLRPEAARRSRSGAARQEDLRRLWRPEHGGLSGLRWLRTYVGPRPDARAARRRLAQSLAPAPRA